ncbi:recombinase family protein [Streptomyces sp. GD-15H]|uniref:recombinase family protein n=1 Tax=Streptomyces sp. GD-15H TaxID=3129112 RepID=UPI0032486CCB
MTAFRNRQAGTTSESTTVGYATPPFGARVGYARVSTKGQLLDRQVAALNEADRVRVSADKKSGKKAGREELRKCLGHLRPGDTLLAPSLDRLGRSIQDLIFIFSALCKRGIGSSRCTSRWTPRPRAGSWCSTCSPRSRGSSGN